MLRFAEVGYRVLGIDTDENKNALLNKGHSYIKHIVSERICAVKNLIKATSDFSLCSEADALILCVPTH
jgi:UDP-N-acetyl-D-glucosamine dehydrogenase